MSSINLLIIILKASLSIQKFNLKTSNAQISTHSGATESNNMTIKGVARFYKQKKHIITCQTEHKCVLDSCRVLQEEGFDVTYLPVNEDGLISLEVYF